MAKAKKTKEKEAKKVSKASKEQIEEMIAKLSKQELTAAKIGLELKKEGIYVKGDKISKIIEKQGTKKPVPDDLADLVKKADSLKKHRIKNKKDMVAKRGLQIIEARIRKLSFYYKKKKKLPSNWAY